MPKITHTLSLLLLTISTLLSPAPLQARTTEKPIILISGPETTDFLDKIAAPILEAAGIIPESVKFHIMLNPSLNAIALPSYDIVFHSGLLLSAESIAEVAGVIAHEVAHLAAGHHIKLQAEIKDVSVRTILFGLAGIAAGVVSGNGQIAQATIVGGSASGQATLLSGQRQKETQADRLAILYLAKAGYSAHGLADFMARIQKEQSTTNMPPPYLLSHPLSSTRLVEIRQMAEETKPTDKQSLLNIDSFKRVQAKLLAGNTETPDITVMEFQKKLAKDPNDFNSRYGMAVAMRYAGQLAESEHNLNILLQQNPDDPFMLWERGRTRTDWGKAELAEQDLRAALKQLPDNQDILYWLAFSLKEQKKYRSSSRILRRLTSKHPKKPEYHYLLGIVEGKNQNLSTAHLALARYYSLILETKTAIWHFNESIRIAPADSIKQKIARTERNRLLALDQQKKEKQMRK